MPRHERSAAPEASHARRLVHFHFSDDVSFGLTFHIVATNRDQRHILAVTPKQLVDRTTCRASQHIPKRTVDTGNGFKQKFPVTIWLRKSEHGLPVPFISKGVLTDNQRSELILDDPSDFDAMVTIITVVDEALSAITRPQLGDHRGSLQDIVRTAAKVLRQWDIDGNRLNVLNFHAAPP